MGALNIVSRWSTIIVMGLAAWLGCANALADTPVALYKSFAGNVNFVGTQKTIRTKPNSSDPCAVLASNRSLSAALSGIPSNATVLAAYLYWAGSSSTPDNNVTFEGVARTATRQWVSASTGYDYFAAAVDVTAAVVAKRNGNYSMSGLTVNKGAPYCAVEGVMGGWSLLAIYSSSSEPFRVLNVYEGFQPMQYSSVTLNLSNFKIPTPLGTATGRIAHITWEGDATLSGGGEKLSFNGVELTDASNPTGNQFNSVSNVNGDNNSYGVDFDRYTIGAPLIQAGQTSATTVYASGQDLVLLSAEVVAVPNVPVADLSITKVSASSFTKGANISYTMSVKNNGPNAEAGPITVTDTLPAGLTLVSAAGTGWSCVATGQAVTCTNSSPLANNASASTLTLSATLSANASGIISNTATVSGTAFDNNSSNSSATATNTVAEADLALSMTRNGALAPGQSASYTLTVSNVGQAAETGPVTLTDILPTGLTYVTAGGTGWTCSASGQVVSCSRAGTLAAGAAAAPLVITVAVAGNAAGTIVNSATVNSSGPESNTANNTASNSYTIAASTLYAWYKMDELSWNGSAGEVKDGAGGNRNGVRVGSANTAVSTNGVAGCRVARIPNNSNLANQDAVSVPVKPQDLGMTGTIAFWYKGNTKWNDGTDRMLFDATGDAVGDYAFYLMRTGSGELQFALTDSGNVTPFALTPSFTYAAGSWHHIAVTWSVAAGTGLTVMRVYVDAVQSVPASGANAVSHTTTGAWPSAPNAFVNLYFGDNRSSSVAPWQGSDNSANGDMDEVYVYPGVLSAAEIAQLMSASHACATLDHYELSLPSSSINCMPSNVIVTACGDASSPCTNAYAGVSGTQATLSVPAGSASLGSGSVTFGPNGTAITTLSYPGAGEGAAVAVTLSGEQASAANARRCCPDGASCSVSDSCTSTFHSAGLIIAGSAGGAAISVANQVAGVVSPTYVLRAVKSASGSPQAQACEAALAGTQAVDFAYQCNNPDTCSSGNLMSIVNGSSTPVAANNNGVLSSYAAVNLDFDANGNAPFALNYLDVGKVTLHARKSVNGATLTGSSNAFVVRPYGFELSAIAQGATPNPAAASASGPLFARAGEQFSITVKATNSAGDATPNYGREVVSPGVDKEGVALAVVVDTASFPDMLNVPALDGAFEPFSAGMATGNTFSWSEVGIIKLTPSVADGDYLGAGNVTGATSANIGRFVPHHFGADSAYVINRRELPACSGASASSFTYMGEPFELGFNMNALSAAGALTQNYQGAFAKLSTTDWLAAGGANSIGLRMLGTIEAGASLCQAAFDISAPFHTRFVCSGAGRADIARAAGARVAMGGPPAAPAWALGAAPLKAALVLERADAADGPYGGAPGVTGAVSTLAIGVAPQDSDGVKAAGFDLDADLDTVADHLTVAETSVRHGRLAIANAYGSELLNLPVSLRAQYWADGRFAASGDDNCSPLEPGQFTLAAGKGASIATTVMGGASMRNGLSAGTFRLSKPSNAPLRKGSVILSTFPGSAGPGPLDRYLPGSGTETFGVYKAGPVIFIREMY